MKKKQWKTTKELERSFARYSKISASYLGDNEIEKIAIGMEAFGGEVTVRWKKFPGEEFPVAQLTAYADSFRLLVELKDVIDDLREWDQYSEGYHNQKFMAPDDFISILEKHGFKEIDYQNV